MTARPAGRGESTNQRSRPGPTWGTWPRHWPARGPGPRAAAAIHQPAAQGRWRRGRARWAGPGGPGGQKDPPMGGQLEVLPGFQSLAQTLQLSPGFPRGFHPPDVRELGCLRSPEGALVGLRGVPRELRSKRSHAGTRSCCRKWGAGGGDHSSQLLLIISISLALLDNFSSSFKTQPQGPER